MIRCKFDDDGWCINPWEKGLVVCGVVGSERCDVYKPRYRKKKKK